MLARSYQLLPVIRKHPGLTSKTKKEKILALFRMKPTELLYRLNDKLAYTLGKKKDILNLKEVL